MKIFTSTTPLTEKDLAQTPPWFIDNLCKLIGIDEFNLDVCAIESTKKASRCYSIEERGEDCLNLEWDTLNWCNPPFSNILPFNEKAAFEASLSFRNTAIIMPNNPETAYIRYAKTNADTIIEMPFRLKFLRPDGTPFISEKNGKEQSPQFSCLVAIYTRLGLRKPTSYMYYDFRNGKN